MLIVFGACVTLARDLGRPEQSRATCMGQQDAFLTPAVLLPRGPLHANLPDCLAATSNTDRQGSSCVAGRMALLSVVSAGGGVGVVGVAGVVVVAVALVVLTRVSHFYPSGARLIGESINRSTGWVPWLIDGSIDRSTG